MISPSLPSSSIGQETQLENHSMQPTTLTSTTTTTINTTSPSTIINNSTTTTNATSMINNLVNDKNTMNNVILFYVNGERIELTLNSNLIHKNLAEYLRSDLKLTGTKIGCSEGGCGSCIVMLSRCENNKILNISINACLFPLLHLDGCSIITIEGIKQDSILSLLKSRVVEFNALQCGFCTPGIIMSLYSLLRNYPKPTIQQIELCLDGNLCRCTGYRSIMDMAISLTDDKTSILGNESINGCGNCHKEGGCCKSKSENSTTSTLSNENLNENSNSKNLIKFEKEFLFPFELRNYNSKYLSYKDDTIEWYRPINLKQLSELNINGIPKYIIGNSEVSLEIRHRNFEYSHFISLTHINELLDLNINENNELIIGSSITVQKLMQFLISKYENNSKYSKIKTIIDQCKWFASTPVRNVASIGGNIMTGSPISDLIPIWQCLNANLNLLNIKTNEIRKIPIRNLYIGYRKLNINSNEILLNINIPNIVIDNIYCKAFKQSKRREDGIAIVNACMSMELNSKNIIQDCSISFGGMSFMVIYLKFLNEFLIGKNFENFNFILENSLKLLNENLKLNENTPGGQSLYRMTLSQSFLIKFFTHIKKQLNLQNNEDESIQSEFHYLPKMENYEFGQYIENEKLKPNLIDLNLISQLNPIGKNHVDIYGKKSVEGKSQYLDDFPNLENELQAYPIFTTEPLAKIIEINYSKALEMEGVKYFINSQDVPNNKIGIVLPNEEEVFKSNESTSCGQFIGLILADTLHQAKEASKKVIVKYETIQNPILSIDDAINRNSYFENQFKNLKSNLSFNEFLNFKNSNLNEYEMIEGNCYIGGQEHFYLETQSCLVIPQNGNFMETSGWTIYSSTQSITTTQQLVSRALNISMNQIQVKTPQKLGGGFGGKESRAAILACACSIGALKSQRPVRLILDRNSDMKWSGTRNPFKGEFKCLINKESLKIESVQINLYCNGGYSLDLSGAILEKAILTIDNCYYFKHFEINGNVCKTNLPSNTAFRGFGGPQAMFIIETMLEHVADHLFTKYGNTKYSNLDGNLAMKIRQVNMYNLNENITPCGQLIPDVERIENLFSQSIKISKYDELLNQVNEFNSKNKYIKRGLSIIPSKFGIGFQELFMNQGCTQINIYAPDGSVLINTGGIEIGQGLHTKIVMCVSEKLGIPTELINITSANSNIIPNQIATCGSMGTDLYAGAALIACEELNQRLLPLKKLLFKNKNFTINGSENDKLSKEEWSELINYAYFNRVCLSAIGYNKPSSYFGEQTWNEETMKGNPQLYYVCGTSVCQVEIDVLTGDWQIQSIHIVMDIGDTLNPAIDINQIEGAFTQGIGLYIMEELIWGDHDHSNNNNNNNLNNNNTKNGNENSNNSINRWLPSGSLFSIGPSNYKIPSFNDLSSKFNVHLLLKENTQAHSNIYRSKAIGEPPLQLACCVLFAIRNAIKSFRMLNNNNLEIFTLDSPATCQRIRLLCNDQIINNILNLNQFNNQIILSSNTTTSNNNNNSTSGEGEGEGDNNGNGNNRSIIRVRGNY